MPIEDTVNLPPNLATMIDTCLKEGLFTNEDAAALIRKMEMILYMQIRGTEIACSKCEEH